MKNYYDNLQSHLNKVNTTKKSYFTLSKTLQDLKINFEKFKLETIPR